MKAVYTNKEVDHNQENWQKDSIVFVADLGGTNSNFALLEAATTIRLLYSIHIPSKEIKDFAHAVEWVLNHIAQKLDLNINKACFAGAGPVSLDGAKLTLTNAGWTIDAQQITSKTRLHSVKLINDFQAVAYGVDALPTKSISQLYGPTSKMTGQHFPKVVMGAGTGLGKALLVWDECKKAYVALSCESGQENFCPVTDKEFALVKFIQENHDDGDTLVKNEELLSGRGLGNIYKFFEQSGKYSSNSFVQQSNYDPKIIAQHTSDDECANKTFEWFCTFYGRIAKNFTLSVMARGGVYLAGGVTMQNPALVQCENFMNEFLHDSVMRSVLEEIPIYLITDYNVSLYGAARYLVISLL